MLIFTHVCEPRNIQASDPTSCNYELLSIVFDGIFSQLHHGKNTFLGNLNVVNVSVRKDSYLLTESYIGNIYLVQHCPKSIGLELVTEKKIHD